MDGLVPINDYGVLSAQLAHLSEDAKRFGGFFDQLSERTRLEYKYAVTEFLTLFRGEIYTPQDIKRHHIAAYRRYIIDVKKLASNTVHKKLSALSSLCAYLSNPDVGLMDSNPCVGMNRGAREALRETAALSRLEVKAVFETLDPVRFNYFFNRAFLAVGFYCGLRVREICNLKTKHLLTEGSVWIIRIQTKGSKFRKVSIHPIALKYINEHLEDLGKRGFNPEDGEQFVFPNLRNPKQVKPISVTSGEYIFNVHVEKAGIVGSKEVRRFSSHSMRATFATRLSELEVPLERIQAELGHSRPETTQVYIKTKHSAESSPVFRLDY